MNRRLLACGALLCALLTPALAAAQSNTPDSVQYPLVKGAYGQAAYMGAHEIWNPGCNSGVGGFVGATYGAVLCTLPGTGGGGGGGVIQYNTNAGATTNVTPATPLPVTDSNDTAPLPGQTSTQVDIGMTEQIRVAPISSTAAESCHVLKTSAATVYSLSGYAGQAELLMLFNAPAAPADGAVTPVWWGSAGAAGPWGVSFPNPETLSAGAVICASATAGGPFTKTGIATNNAFSGQVQ